MKNQIIVIVVVVIFILFRCIHDGTNFLQLGGSPNNLGYMTQHGYNQPEGNIEIMRHVLPPPGVHPHDAVNTNTSVDKRKYKEHNKYYYYYDKFDFIPYDWRPADIKPEWFPHSCDEYATSNCIGNGSSDYQSCYNDNIHKCENVNISN